MFTKLKQMATIACTASKPLSSTTHPLISLLEICESMDQLQQIDCRAIKTGLTPNPVLQNRRLLRLDSPELGVSLYLEMLRRGVKPDNYTFPFLFKGFTRDISLQCGSELHGHVLKHGLLSNVFVHTALVQMYLLCGLLDMARGVLDAGSKADVISWNMMIAAYNKVGKLEESRRLFLACSKLKDFKTGKHVRSCVNNCKVESNLVLENALIDMYAACGEMDSALEIFRNMNNKDIISWTTIVSGFTNLGEIDVARNYFDQMPEKDCVFPGLP
ncbi:putative pentatricopeptide repeat-containing protein, partial [Cucurbita argyrosperma subsp. sororia]